MDNIIKIGDFSIELKRRKDNNDSPECKHDSISMDDNGDIVKCTDCNMQLSAYWALCQFTKEFNEYTKQLDGMANEMSKFPEKQNSIFSNIIKIANQAIWALESGEPDKARLIIEDLNETTKSVKKTMEEATASIVKFCKKK